MKHAVLISIALASVASAETLPLSQDRMTAWIPDKWSVGTENGMTVAQAPSGEASVVFASKPIRDLDVAYKKTSEVVGAILPSVQFGKPSRTTLAGLAAIQIRGVSEVATDDGTVTIEANVAVVATPNQRALYVIVFAQAERARAYDSTTQKIFGGLRAAESGGASKPGPNPCWEFNSHPNGWRSQSWQGVKFLMPPGWTKKASEDPDTGASFLTLSHDDGSSVVMFAQAAESASEAWASVQQIGGDYGLGKPAAGAVAGQQAVCARGSGGGVTDGVVIHKGSTAIVMLARGSGDGSSTRAILGSMRVK